MKRLPQVLLVAAMMLAFGAVMLVGHYGGDGGARQVEAGDPTPTPTPAPVGGILDTVDVGESPAEGSASSSRDYTLPIAAGAAGAVLALAAGVWYARSRLS